MVMLSSLQYRPVQMNPYLTISRSRSISHDTFPSFLIYLFTHLLAYSLTRTKSPLIHLTFFQHTYLITVSSSALTTITTIKINIARIDVVKDLRILYSTIRSEAPKKLFKKEKVDK